MNDINEQTFEVEVRCMLGEKSNAEALKQKLMGIGCKKTGESKHKNHYFDAPSDASELYERIKHLIEEVHWTEMEKLLETKEKTVRTRGTESGTYFIIKASVVSEDSIIGVERIEFQKQVELPQEELDQILLDSGFSVNTKWSRSREDFLYEKMGMEISIDENAGWGNMAEFEMITNDASQTSTLRQNIVDFMSQLGLEEVSQERLARMLEHYTKHWEEYYGTDKTFVVQ